MSSWTVRKNKFWSSTVKLYTVVVITLINGFFDVIEITGWDLWMMVNNLQAVCSIMFKERSERKPPPSKILNERYFTVPIYTTSIHQIILPYLRNNTSRPYAGHSLHCTKPPRGVFSNCQLNTLRCRIVQVRFVNHAQCLLPGRVILLS